MFFCDWMNDAYAKPLRPRLRAVRPDLIARNDVDPARPAWADPALSTVFSATAPTSPLPDGSRSTPVGGISAGVVSARFPGLNVTDASLWFLLPSIELGHALNLLFLGDNHCVLINTRVRTLHDLNCAVRGKGITPNTFTSLVYSFHARSGNTSRTLT